MEKLFTLLILVFLTNEALGRYETDSVPKYTYNLQPLPPIPQHLPVIPEEHANRYKRQVNEYDDEDEDNLEDRYSLNRPRPDWVQTGPGPRPNRPGGRPFPRPNGNQGFSNSNQGLPNSNQGFPNSNQGSPNSNQGSNQGFPNSNQGSTRPNQGAGQQNQGQQPNQQNPATGTTTESPTATACITKCPVTPEYNPVCGSNGMTYPNPGRLICAQMCGVVVTMARSSPCPTTTTT